MADTTYEKFKIVDSHAHIFPEKIAEKATQATGDFYGIKMTYAAGFPHSLIESGEKIGVSKYLVCSTATRPDQVQSINDFICRKCEKYDQFFGFATLHPEMDDCAREIDRLVSLGLHGVKLHPDFQRFNIDYDKAIDMYKEVAKYHIPILFHMGDDRFDFSSPRRLVNAMEKVPDLVCIAAHFGGYRQWDDALIYPVGSDRLFFDTSSALPFISKETARDLIAHFGDDMFIFGSDFPMWGHEQAFSEFISLDLTDEQRAKILYKNFERLFKIKI